MVTIILMTFTGKEPYASEMILYAFSYEGRNYYYCIPSAGHTVTAQCSPST